MHKIEIPREELIKHLEKGTVGAELGVGMGKFSKHIVTNMELKKLYCIDLWAPISKHVQGPFYTDDEGFEERYQSIKKDLEQYPIEVIRDLTYNAPNYIKEKELDWAYVDGDHTYDGCKKDLDAVDALVHDNGYIMGHDHTYKAKRNWGVIEAVREIAKEKGYIHSLVTVERWPTYIVSKTPHAHEKLMAQIKDLL